MGVEGKERRALETWSAALRRTSKQRSLRCWESFTKALPQNEVPLRTTYSETILWPDRHQATLEGANGPRSWIALELRIGKRAVTCVRLGDSKEGERQLPNAEEGWGFACLGLFSVFRVEETLALPNVRNRKDENNLDHLRHTI